MPPYTTWATAATNIQDAVGAAAAGDVVVVSNGVYAGGITVNTPLTLLSASGPEATVINGGGTNQCAKLTAAASLNGFTLTNGRAQSGGGVSCSSAEAFLTNCVIAGNWAVVGSGAYYSTLYNCTLSNNFAAQFGGGAFFSMLYNCTLSSNSVTSLIGSGGGAHACTLYNCTLSNNSANGQIGFGGGATGCTLYNCLLTSNSASIAGGAYQSTLYNCTLGRNSASANGGVLVCVLYNCIVYFNESASGGANCDSGSQLNYCCTTPQPTNGFGNLTNAPLFVDYTNGNLRLQSNSPCINAGNNAYVTTATDLDGNPRIVGGTVDIGAYEYQGTGSVISYAWLQQYGLPTDGSADYADYDGDGMNVCQDWVAGLNPTNALSVLRLLSPSSPAPTSTVTWQSVAGVNYLLERSANLASPFMLLATNIVGQAGTTSYADTNATGAGPFFYRVGVQAP